MAALAGSFPESTPAVPSIIAENAPEVTVAASA